MFAPALLLAGGVLFLAALYAAAGLVGGLGSVQIVRMLAWQHTSAGAWLHASYAALLALAAAAALGLSFRPRPAYRIAGFSSGALIALITAAALALSPGPTSFYEGYVGESVTLALAVLLLAFSLTRREPARLRAV
jgi:hypothetical protein